MRRSDPDIPGVGIVILLIICFFGALFFHHLASDDCKAKGGHLANAHYKTFICVSKDGRILE